MHAFSLGRWFVGLLTTIGLVLLPQSLRAADKQEVKFYTFDKVELHGTFYSGNGGTKSSCVMLVHNLGGSRDKAGWDELATALQKKDFAVLSFDLRGHGDSQDVTAPDFWTASSANTSLIRGASRDKTKITFKEFSPRYYPMIANDLTAAKRFLDDQNNAQLCNSSNVIVIGAEEGAAIGALWIYSEWDRKAYVKDAFGRSLPTGPAAGEDITCAVWLSISPALSGVSVSNWFRTTPEYPIRDKVPMAFVYGTADAPSARTATMLLGLLQGNKPKTTSLSALRPKEGNAAGVKLLAPSLQTVDDIGNYLDKVLEKRAASAWTNRDTTLPVYPIPLGRYGFAGLGGR